MSQRPSGAFLALAGLVIAAAVTIRFALLGRQSYWIDELFSVNQSAGSLQNMAKVGSTEVHTPLYAALLWGWMRIGDTHGAWTRLLSTLCAVIAVVVTSWGSRAVRLSDHVRWALAVATAASGTSIVYSLETRSYALLLLGAVGLTITTLRAALMTLDADQVRPRTYLAWVGWAALAATAHLFGAVLTLGALTVLAAVTVLRAPRPRGRRVVVWVLLAAAACSLQAGWLIRGLNQPAFAAGTNWIHAPRGQDIWDLVTTTFSSGALTTHKDGFAWTSPIGVIAAAALCLAAAPAGYRRRARGAAATAELRAAAILLALATVVTVSVFGISQGRHLWTLRNMVIVTPALMWGVICLGASAARTAAGRRQVATVAVTLLGLSLAPTTIGLAQPYKTDFRGLFEYLISEGARQPETTYIFFRASVGPAPPRDWRVASDRSDDDPAWRALFPHTALYPGGAQNAVARVPGPKVVTIYPGVANPMLDQEVSTLVTRLGGARCQRIPIYGLGVVRCD
jgi:uncharacterized membrane protein